MSDELELIPYKKHGLDLERDTFNKLSYSKWALSELVLYISENKTMSPIILIENFINKMDKNSRKGMETDLIFSIGRDTVLDILDAHIISDYNKIIEKERKK